MRPKTKWLHGPPKTAWQVWASSSAPLFGKTMRISREGCRDWWLELLQRCFISLQPNPLMQVRYAGAAGPA